MAPLTGRAVHRPGRSDHWTFNAALLLKTKNLPGLPADSDLRDYVDGQPSLIMDLDKAESPTFSTVQSRMGVVRPCR